MTINKNNRAAMKLAVSNNSAKKSRSGRSHAQDSGAKESKNLLEQDSLQTRHGDVTYHFVTTNIYLCDCSCKKKSS